MVSKSLKLPDKLTQTDALIVDQLVDILSCSALNQESLFLFGFLPQNVAD
jgi:hypothetical protein